LIPPLWPGTSLSAFFQQLQHLGDRDSKKFYAALSSESREFHSDLSIGVSAWTKGYKRADISKW
jgi:hypothetical protein